VTQTNSIVALFCFWYQMDEVQHVWEKMTMTYIQDSARETLRKEINWET